MAIFGLDSLLKRVDWVKVGTWCIENGPKIIFGGYVVKKGSEVLHHFIDSHKETVEHMADKAAETGSYVHATNDGDYTFDARKRNDVPERVEGEFVDTPEAIPETI